MTFLFVIGENVIGFLNYTNVTVTSVMFEITFVK